MAKKAAKKQDAPKEPANEPKAKPTEDGSLDSLEEHVRSFLRYTRNSEKVLGEPLMYQVVRSDPAYPRYACVRQHPDARAEEIARLDHGKYVYGFPGPRWVKLSPANGCDVQEGWAFQGRQLVVQCLKVSGCRDGCRLDTEWEGVATKGGLPAVVQYDLEWQPKEGRGEPDNWRAVKIVDETKVSLDDVPETGSLELRVIALVQPAQTHALTKFKVFGPRMKVTQGQFGHSGDLDDTFEHLSPPVEDHSASSTMKVDAEPAICRSDEQPLDKAELDLPSPNGEERQKVNVPEANVLVDPCMRESLPAAHETEHAPHECATSQLTEQSSAPGAFEISNLPPPEAEKVDSDASELHSADHAARTPSPAASAQDKKETCIGESLERCASRNGLDASEAAPSEAAPSEAAPSEVAPSEVNQVRDQEVEDAYEEDVKQEAVQNRRWSVRDVAKAFELQIQLNSRGTWACPWCSTENPGAHKICTSCHRPRGSEIIARKGSGAKPA